MAKKETKTKEGEHVPENCVTLYYPPWSNFCVTTSTKRLIEATEERRSGETNEWACKPRGTVAQNYDSVSNTTRASVATMAKTICTDARDGQHDAEVTKCHDQFPENNPPESTMAKTTHR